MGTINSIPQQASMQPVTHLKSKETPIKEPPIATNPEPSTPLPYQYIHKFYHPLFGDLILIQDLQRNQQMAVIEFAIM